MGRQSPKRTWYESLMFLMSLIATVYARDLLMLPFFVFTTAT